MRRSLAWSSKACKVWLTGVAIYAEKCISIFHHNADHYSMRKRLTHLCSQLAGDVILEAKSTDSKVDREPPPGGVCRMHLSQPRLCPLHL